MPTNLSTQPYKGTRDFYPDEMAVQNYIFNRVKSVLHGFGYQQYDGPMLEPFELYAAKTSEEIVNEQLYHFVDRGNRKLAIRPEMTPTLARMVAARRHELPCPIRWFSIPNLWRYERPQRGRLREHWQLNVDVFGGNPLLADLEICEVIHAIMRGFGATAQYEVRLNHRGLTNHIFSSKLKLTEAQIPLILRLLDAAPKMGADAFKEALVQAGIQDEQASFLVSLLNEDGVKKLESELVNVPAFKHLADLMALLSGLGISDRFRYCPQIMRGFLYYTGMVLEVFDLHPENNRALFGGGRFDDLVGLFGGTPLPGTGFGMGDVTIKNFLESHGLLPDFGTPSGIFIAHLSETEIPAAQKLAFELRAQMASTQTALAQAALPIYTTLETAKTKKYFITAGRLRAKYILFVGSNEIASGRFVLKNLATGEPIECARDEILLKYESARQ